MTVSLARSKFWNWLHSATSTVCNATDSQFDQIDCKCRDSLGICPVYIRKIGQEFPLSDLLDSFRNPKVARSIAILLNYKNETDIRETFFDQSVVEINSQKRGNEHH